MKLSSRRILLVLVTAGLAGGLLTPWALGQQASVDRDGIWRDGFESDATTWQREYSDTTVNLLEHDRSERAAHHGRKSEHFRFEVGAGRQFFVSYTVPRVPVTDDLSVAVYARSTRAGVQVLGRVVLPADMDPETKAPSFVLVPGTIFDQVDRWQRLELVDLVPSVERQARVLRISTKRPVSLEGAYLERVVVNLLGSPGETEVFLDDLEITPMPKQGLAPAPGSARPAAGASEARPAGVEDAVAASGRVRLERNLLQKKGSDGLFHGWIPTAIDAPGASFAKMRQAGLDVLVVPPGTDAAQLKSAVDRGFLLMPRVEGAATEGGADRVLDQIRNYPQRGDVAFWHMGDKLGRNRDIKAREDELAQVRATLSAVRGLEDDVSHLATATVEGELPLYTRAPTGFDMVGIKPRYWGGVQTFNETFQYLIQRKRLTVRSNVGGLFWAWISASVSPDVVRNIWGEDTPPVWGIPPVQPEQLRLMTYLALAAGYRGIGYLADENLTQPAGQILLNELSFLNLEIDLCEEILAESVESKTSLMPVYDPPPPDVPSNATQQLTKRTKAVKEFDPKPGLGFGTIVIPGRRGSLLLVGDFTDNAQYQPPQLAADKLMITPVLPVGCQGFEISPGEVKVLEPKRVPGGIQFILEEFDTTRLVLCTTDMALYERIRTAVERVRPKAIPLAIQQAELKYKAVKEIHDRLEADGHEIRTDVDLKRRRQAGIETKPTDARDLLQKAETYIKSARDALEREDYAWAWAEARRASRPLRILMFYHWLQAFTTMAIASNSINPTPPTPTPGMPKPPPEPAVLIGPVSCPPLISYFTLPELYIWADWIKGRPGYRFGTNLCPSGNFNDPEAMSDAGWTTVSYRQEGLVGDIKTVTRSSANGKSPNPKSPSVDELSAENRKDNRVVKMVVRPEKQEELDELPGFLDFPIAAIRSPAIKVEANNLIRISVMVRRPWQSQAGLGGIIVRDSIGGEELQYRSTAPIPTFSRVVLYRKAPANGTFHVTLGLAGFGEAYFDNFRVEVIEEAPIRGNGSPDPGLVQRPRRSRGGAAPALPDPNLPAAASRPVDSRRQQR